VCYPASLLENIVEKVEKECGMTAFLKNKAGDILPSFYARKKAWDSM
jgi:hypothetical protein